MKVTQQKLKYYCLTRQLAKQHPAQPEPGKNINSLYVALKANNVFKLIDLKHKIKYFSWTVIIVFNHHCLQKTLIFPETKLKKGDRIQFISGQNGIMFKWNS